MIRSSSPNPDGLLFLIEAVWHELFIVINFLSKMNKNLSENFDLILKLSDDLSNRLGVTQWRLFIVKSVKFQVFKRPGVKKSGFELFYENISFSFKNWNFENLNEKLEKSLTVPVMEITTPHREVRVLYKFLFELPYNLAVSS